MISSLTSLFSSISSLIAPRSAESGKTSNSVSEAAQKGFHGLAQTQASALTVPGRVAKFKDNSFSYLYPLFFQTLSQVLGSYTSPKSGHCFVSPILTLIAEYEDELIPLVPQYPIGRQFVSSIGFGKKMWNDYFGD